MAISPGTYLRKRREAAGLTLEAVAAKLATEPRLGELDRLAWLRLIEADSVPIGATAIAALHIIFRFDGQILDRLADLHYCSAQLPAPQLCRVCACSWLHPCVDEHGGACSWADRDLCTECAAVTGSPAPAAPAPAEQPRAAA